MKIVTADISYNRMKLLISWNELAVVSSGLKMAPLLSIIFLVLFMIVNTCNGNYLRQSLQ